ncbi:hypothetical protein B0J17DRAFT_683308 [Rhizoctonia solani]|nr:hypothetical protein B0J17DRAFT_683308 [Rhizoctonia solani]
MKLALRAVIALVMAITISAAPLPDPAPLGGVSSISELHHSNDIEKPSSSAEELLAFSAKRALSVNSRVTSQMLAAYVSKSIIVLGSSIKSFRSLVLNFGCVCR